MAQQRKWKYSASLDYNKDSAFDEREVWKRISEELEDPFDIVCYVVLDIPPAAGPLVLTLFRRLIIRRASS